MKRIFPVVFALLAFSAAGRAESLSVQAEAAQREAVNAANKACSLVAATAIVGAKDHGNLPKWIAQCNADSTKSECLVTIGFIKANNDGNVPAVLDCTTGRTESHSVQAPSPETAAADNACALLAASILAGADDHGNLPKWIERCNADPAKSKCLDTRSFIVMNNDGLAPPGLTCR